MASSYYSVDYYGKSSFTEFLNTFIEKMDVTRHEQKMHLIKRSELQERYAVFCRELNEPIASNVNIGRHLGHLGIKCNTKIGVAGKQVRCYSGVRWVPEAWPQLGKKNIDPLCTEFIKNDWTSMDQIRAKKTTLAVVCPDSQPNPEEKVDYSTPQTPLDEQVNSSSSQTPTQEEEAGPVHKGISLEDVDAALHEIKSSVNKEKELSWDDMISSLVNSSSQTPTEEEEAGTVHEGISLEDVDTALHEIMSSVNKEKEFSWDDMISSLDL